MKGLRAGILECKSIGNCSNKGISSVCRNVTIVPSPDYPMEDAQIFEPDSDAPAVQLWNHVGIVIAVPVKNKEAGDWTMMGGCYICTSDGRFPNSYPIPLHDRVE